MRLTSDRLAKPTLKSPMRGKRENFEGCQRSAVVAVLGQGRAAMEASTAVLSEAQPTNFSGEGRKSEGHEEREGCDLDFR